MIGNQQAQQMIDRFFSAFVDGGTSFPFLVVAGKKHLGKTTLIDKIIHDLLGEYASTDYLALYDFSDSLGKEHSIKVEVPRDQETIDVAGISYPNSGMRTVTQWLSLAPLGKYKVVYIENMQRMTTAAANAFLKTLEEPLPGRLIVWSVDRAENLLDTLRSRALIVPFSPLGTAELRDHLYHHYPQATSEEIAFAASFSLWARGVAVRLLEEDTRYEAATFFAELQTGMLSAGRIDLQLQRFRWFAQQGQLEMVLDALLYLRANERTKRPYVERLVRAKQLLETNVSHEHILFRLCAQ